MPDLSIADRTLSSGLRVMTVRRPGVPLVEAQLQIPLGTAVSSDSACVRLLARTLLSGTAAHSQAELSEGVITAGGSLSVSVDADRLLVVATVLAERLTGLLELLEEVLTSACHPDRELLKERARLIEDLAVERARAEVQASQALLRRMFDGHAYAHALPEPESVAAVTATQVRKLHEQRIVPAGAVLVLVGDLWPERAAEDVEASLGRWCAVGTPGEVGMLPPVSAGPPLLVHRPRSAQTSIRLGGSALGRTDPAYPALQLANLVFGGCFSSRLVANLLEDKGYAYGVLSRIDHGSAGSIMVIHADVAPAMTARALSEILSELDRITTLAVEQSELDDARRYALGALARSLGTQASFATSLSQLAATGLGADWLRDHPTRLEQVNVADVADVAARILTPSRMATVVLGDTDLITPLLTSL